MPATRSATPLAVCGDEFLDAGETCDDGNLAAGDGCSAACQVEPGFTCTDPIPPAPGGNRVADGSFEAGTPNPSWTEYSLQFGTPLCDPATCGQNGASDGQWWAWFGGIDDFEEASLEQTVIIPPTATSLTFDLRITECDSTADFLSVQVDGSERYHRACAVTGGYVPVTVSVPEFADGHTHTLSLESTTFSNNLGSSSFFVDRVELDDGTGGLPIPSQCTPLAVCGDALLGAGETCDDGNVAAGDGCSATCQVEPGFECTDPIPQGANAVADGSFEAGTPNPSWTEHSLQFGTPLCDPTTCQVNGASDGLWWAWFGGIDAFEEASVGQTVIIPPSATLLTFDLRITECDSDDDFLSVQVDSSELYHRPCEVTGSYFPVSLSLHDFADGGAHTLTFAGTTFSNNLRSSSFFVDRVELDVPIPSECTPAPDADADSIPDDQDNCTVVANVSQRDTDLDGFGNDCDADFDESCSVNFSDLGTMKANFFQPNTTHTDMNGDGQTNFVDLGMLKGYFFLPPGPSGVPNICSTH